MTEKKTLAKTGQQVVEENSEKIVNDAVRFINEKANETLYKGSIEIGEYSGKILVRVARRAILTL